MTYPQQPGDYGGFDQNANYGGLGGGGQYGGVGGPPGGPPRRNLAPIISITIIIVFILGGVAVTGFVSPGFFLSDDKDTAGGSGTQTSSSATNGDSGADAFLDKLVDAADQQDKGTLSDFACEDAEHNVQSAIDDIDDIDGVTLSDTENVSDDEVKATFDITYEDEPHPFDVTIVKDGDNWCWQDIAGEDGGMPSTTAEEPGAPPATATGTDNGEDTDAGVAAIDDFVTKINNGDGAGAKSIMCDDTTSKGDVDDAVTGKAKLQVDKSKLELRPRYVGADMTGTNHGKQIFASRASAYPDDENGGWCIYIFYAYT